MADTDSSPKTPPPLSPKDMNAEPSNAAYSALHRSFTAPIPPMDDDDPMTRRLPGGLLYGRVLELRGAPDSPMSDAPLAVVINPRGEYHSTAASPQNESEGLGIDVKPGERVAS